MTKIEKRFGTAVSALLFAAVFGFGSGGVASASEGKPGEGKPGAGTPGEARPPGPERQGGGDEAGRRRGPSPAALDACKGKKADDACEAVFGADRKMTGKCAPTRDAQLACRPDRPMGPPPEFLKACEGKKEGEACTVTFGDKTRDGKCAKGRSDKLICRR